MATKRLKVELYNEGVIITASTYNTGDHIIDYPLGLDSIGRMSDVLNAVFKAGQEVGAMNARVKTAEKDIDRANKMLAEMLAERVTVKAKENICTVCGMDSGILHHVTGEPGTALCPRCHALHTEAKTAQSEMAIVTPFDPIHTVLGKDDDGNPTLTREDNGFTIIFPVSDPKQEPEVEDRPDRPKTTLAELWETLVEYYELDADEPLDIPETDAELLKAIAEIGSDREVAIVVWENQFVMIDVDNKWYYYDDDVDEFHHGDTPEQLGRSSEYKTLAEVFNAS